MPICDEALLETERWELRITAVTPQEDVDKPAGNPLAGENFAAEQLSDSEIDPTLRLKTNCETQQPTAGLILEPVGP